jgi:hypothetical protein
MKLSGLEKLARLSQIVMSGLEKLSSSRPCVGVQNSAYSYVMSNKNTLEMRVFLFIDFRT